MSSTRNRNSASDYILEQRQYRKGFQYYTNLASVESSNTLLPGNGLLAGRIAATNFAFNNVDIESQLYGIGSSNMVSAKPIVKMDAKNIKSLNIADRIKTFVPRDFVFEGGQRPYPS